MQRVIEPEWLDELPAGDPRAIRSRKDLQRLNRFMGHAVIMSRCLASIPKPARVIDLGAGDGFVSVALAKKLPWRGTEFVLVDRSEAVSGDTRNEMETLGCPVAFHRCDVLEGLEKIGPADVAFANLFLHHFHETELMKLLGEIAQHCRLFLACEPRRSPLALWGSRFVACLGCNDVTRHDAVISVRAGFNDRELSALWPANGEWSLTERAAGLFSHLFVATRA